MIHEDEPEAAPPGARQPEEVADTLVPLPERGRCVDCGLGWDRTQLVHDAQGSRCVVCRVESQATAHRVVGRRRWVATAMMLLLALASLMAWVTQRWEAAQQPMVTQVWMVALFALAAAAATHALVAPRDASLGVVVTVLAICAGAGMVLSAAWLVGL